MKATFIRCLGAAEEAGGGKPVLYYPTADITVTLPRRYSGSHARFLAQGWRFLAESP